MANVGLSSFLYAPLEETAAGHRYGTIAKLAGAIESKIALNISEGTLYSDNVLKYSNYGVSSATTTLGIDSDDDAVFGPILGYEKKTVSIGSGSGAPSVEQYEIKADSDGGYYGFGQIESRADKTFEARVLRKVKFKPFVGDSKSSGATLEYTTPSVEGTASGLLDGSAMEVHANCATLANAVAFIRQILSEDTLTGSEDTE